MCLRKLLEDGDRPSPGIALLLAHEQGSDRRHACPGGAFSASQLEQLGLRGRRRDLHGLAGERRVDQPRAQSRARVIPTLGTERREADRRSDREAGPRQAGPRSQPLGQLRLQVQIWCTATCAAVFG